ncbi:MAG: metallophosphoesterase [Nitrososphaeraceae archaeon]|nr:metallophosphoesterase [Nitrososphaeraceae archaeon]
MRLVQLSDIHFGSLFRQDVYDLLVDEINNEIKPDVLIITGDLTDDGLLFQFKKIHEEIKKFECQNKIILPGNHDYRHTGYLLFKKFFSSKQIFELGNVIVLTLGTARPERDEGEVGHRQNLWMEKTLAKYPDHVKIIAMHHHLIGIPDTGSDKIIILDAGDTLRSCLQSSVNLVLCGHKHRPWIWKLGPLKIAYAGTASSNRFRGFFENSYNVINIDANKKIELEIKIVGGEKFPLDDLVEKYTSFKDSILF